MRIQKRPLPSPSQPGQSAQRACEHTRLEPKEPHGDVYECADCGYQARATFAHVTRGREDA